MAKIAVFGTVFVDCKGNAYANYDPLGRNLGEVRFVHGGVGRNVAENLACLGDEVAFVSTVDLTGIGMEVRERLRQETVDVSGVIPVRNGMGMWLVVMDENGTQRGSISQMPDLEEYGKYVSENAERIISICRGVAIEIDLNAEISGKIIKEAKLLGKPVYGITGNMSVILEHKEFLRETDCYICNETETGRLFCEDISVMSEDKILELLGKEAPKLGIPSMVTTLGKRGCVYRDFRTGEKGVCPICEAKVVDTCGAGDAFFSGAVSALMNGKSLSEAVIFGTRTAALIVSTTENTLKRCREILFSGNKT